MEQANDFWVESLYGYKTRQPLVAVTLGEAQAQVSPVKALEMAQMLTTAAESAIQDGFLVYFLMEKLEQPEDVAAQILRDFRDYRDKQRHEEEPG